MSKPGAERLTSMLQRNHGIAERVEQADFPVRFFEELQHWQRARLSRSYSDLEPLEGYRPAIHFFLSELYGGLDFRDRDQDLGRVMPVMIRFLPDRALVTLSEAFELQALSLEYDVGMARHMEQAGLRELDMQSYGDVYRGSSDRAGRERQILLIRKLGRDLKTLVHRSIINYLLRLLRGPAHAAGFGNLQEFLETGLAAFRALEDPGHFVDTIYDREWAAMERLFAGDPDPFSFGAS